MPDNPFAQPFDIAPVPQMQMQMPQPKPKGGMFGGGGKFGLKEAIAFGLAGFMSRRNPALLQGLMGAMMQKQDAEREDQQYQQRRGDQFEDWRKQQEFKLAHPDPVNNDTTNDYNFIAEKLGPEAANQWLKNMGDPIVTTNLPGSRVYSGPRSQLGAALGAQPPTMQAGHVEDGFRFKGGNPGDPNAWEPLNGGPTQPASGGFPGSY